MVLLLLLFSVHMIFFLLFLLFISVHIEHFRWTVCAVECMVLVTLSILYCYLPIQTHWMCMCVCIVIHFAIFPVVSHSLNFSLLFPLCLSVSNPSIYLSKTAAIHIFKYSQCFCSRVYWSFIMRTPSISTNLSLTHQQRLILTATVTFALHKFFFASTSTVSSSFSFPWLSCFAFYLARKHQFYVCVVYGAAAIHNT